MSAEGIFALIETLAEQYALAAGTLTVFIVFTWLQWNFFERMMNEKNKELHSIIESRDKLQEILIDERISSKTESRILLDRLEKLEKKVGGKD